MTLSAPVVLRILPKWHNSHTLYVHHNVLIKHDDEDNSWKIFWVEDEDYSWYFLRQSHDLANVCDWLGEKGHIHAHNDFSL